MIWATGGRLGLMSCNDLVSAQRRLAYIVGVHTRNAASLISDGNLAQARYEACKARFSDVTLCRMFDGGMWRMNQELNVLYLRGLLGD